MKLTILISFFVGLFCACARQPNASPVLLVKPTIVRELPHDTLAFTQGLLLHDRKLFESTGLEGLSSLRILNALTGALEEQQSVAGVFAEGLAYLDGRLVLLTWKNQIAFVYDGVTRKKIGTFNYSGEGWGLASFARGYVMSNGSDTLYFRSSAFLVTKKVQVTYKGRPLARLNELEVAHDKIYANVWYNDFIYEIDPHSGAVTRTIDCSDLIAKAQPIGDGDVLNGIAYDSIHATFYVTGKNWRKIFVVKW